MKNYCPDLFNNIFVQKATENTVELGHCCVSKLTKPEDKIDPTTADLEANRQYYLDTGELPSACDYCKKAEAQGMYSRRQHHSRHNYANNNFPTKFKLESLDYNCDNICNLKCIICSSYYSSSWIEDEKLLNLPTRHQIKHTKHNRLIEDIDVSNVERIYFNGGEPLMTRDHINVLNYLVEHGNPANTQILYSTNGTFALTDEIVELWTKFKGLDLSCSIDGIGEVFNYVRYPGNWAQVEQNLISFKTLRSKMNVFLNLGITIGVHNVLYFDQLYAWAHEHGYTLQIQDTNGRGQLSLENFPRQHVDTLHQYLDRLPESDARTRLLEMTKNITGADPRWAEYLNNLDNIRNTSWKTSLSRLYNLDPTYFDSVGTKYRGQPWKQINFT